MKIDTYQSIRIYGWFSQLRFTLAWEDVNQKGLSWRQMREMGFKVEDLKNIQPDKTEWIQRGGLQLTDLNDMIVFPVNPITDFRADLAELWNMQCTPEELTSMGVTFEQLKSRGLNPPIMSCFGWTLTTWVDLGLHRNDIEIMSNDECMRVFSIDKQELMSICDKFIDNFFSFASVALGLCLYGTSN
jgi:hypothetical protein